MCSEAYGKRSRRIAGRWLMMYTHFIEAMVCVVVWTDLEGKLKR